MIAFQIAAVTVAAGSRRSTGRVAAGLLALACGASVASGFFDGQLQRDDLTPAEVGFPVLLLALAGVATTVALTRPAAEVGATS